MDDAEPKAMPSSNVAGNTIFERSFYNDEVIQIALDYVNTLKLH
jgi:hypothetical protein